MLEITDKRCSSCNDQYLWRSVVSAPTLDGEYRANDVLACPTCDRMRCRRCKRTIGKLFRRVEACEHCGATVPAVLLDDLA